jgi:hypothetical protein
MCPHHPIPIEIVTLANITILHVQVGVLWSDKIPKGSAAQAASWFSGCMSQPFWRHMLPKRQICRAMPPPNSQHLQCNPLLLIINDPPLCPPNIFRKCGLWAPNAYKNPISVFLLELLPEHQLKLWSQHYLPNSTVIRWELTIVEVKDLRQTIAIEMGYQETNA